MRSAISDEIYEIYHDGFPDDSHAYYDCFLETVSDHAFLRENGELVSVGFLVEKEAVLMGEHVKIAYLSGLCTRKKYRGKGYMVKVVDSLLNKAYDKRYPLLFLSPFNNSYYHRFGFEDLTMCNDVELKTEYNPNIKVLKSFQPDLEELKEIYRKCVFGCGNYLIFDDTQIKCKLREYAADGIPICIAYKEKKPVAFYFCNNEEIEFWMGDCSALKSIEDLHGKRCRVLNKTGLTVHLQARVCNVYEFNKLFNTKLCGKIKIKDAFIRQNNSNEYPAEITEGQECKDVSFLTRTAIAQMHKAGNFFIDKY